MSENDLLIAWGRIVIKRCTAIFAEPLTDRENAICDKLVAAGFDEDTMDEYAVLAVQEHNWNASKHKNNTNVLDICPEGL
jgi:hypothetical protein